MISYQFPKRYLSRPPNIRGSPMMFETKPELAWTFALKKVCSLVRFVTKNDASTGIPATFSQFTLRLNTVEAGSMPYWPENLMGVAAEQLNKLTFVFTVAPGHGDTNTGASLLVRYLD